ncbi:uncharacterized protein RCO7_00821 [Rhynchosporium graminicola]|uniref:Uncharacterized protein n=1 Tax=Rhynchosporium graminicola TaxID=2792576 RepID=A0A1E1K2V8_9HELO|nr:uncharacterized protein RCO7_00821 [Rhynchosporium commune]
MYWVAVLVNILVLLTWLFILSYSFVLIPKRFMWLIRLGERRRILDQLAQTEPHKRNEKMMDMCFPWIGGGIYGTDDFMLYLDTKFRMMEDAGMFGDNGAVRHELSWGHLENDSFIERVLEVARMRHRYGKSIIAEEFRDLLGRSPGLSVALSGTVWQFRKDLEEWNKTQVAVQNEKSGIVLVDREDKEGFVLIDIE